MSQLFTDIVANPMTPDQLHAGRDEEEVHRAVLARFTAGDVTALIERFDYWENGKLGGPSLIEAAIDFPGNRVGFADIEVMEDDPPSVTSLPDLAVVVTAVHAFVTEWIAKREAVSG